LVFCGPAEGADPVGGKILERGSGLDSPAVVPGGGIVDITAQIAYVLFHFVISLPILWRVFKVFSRKTFRKYC
jgi:hypothetical protein